MPAQQQQQQQEELMPVWTLKAFGYVCTNTPAPPSNPLYTTLPTFRLCKLLVEDLGGCHKAVSINHQPSCRVAAAAAAAAAPLAMRTPSTAAAVAAGLAVLAEGVNPQKTAAPQEVGKHREGPSAARASCDGHNTAGTRGELSRRCCSCCCWGCCW